MSTGAAQKSRDCRATCSATRSRTPPRQSPATYRETPLSTPPIDQEGHTRMEWCRLYANLDGNDRVQAAEDAAENSAWLLVQSMMYCTAAESQGFIPRTQVPRFGGRNTDQRVKALVSEGLWIPRDRGYLLDPDVWNEERNLSDSAEKKKKADRERMAAKRAAERAARASEGEESRDSRATGRATRSATPSRDSRTQRREEEKRTSPQPPREPRPLWPAALNPEEEGEGSSPDESKTALAAQIREIRPEWSTRSILRVLAKPEVAERPWPIVIAAALAVAGDPASEQPGRLAHDGPWWHRTRAAAAPPPKPPWCGQCDENTRQVDTDDGKVARCQNCHPLNQQKAS